MARNKNALRGHFVQEYTPGEDAPGTTWLELARYISTITNDPSETTEEEAFYDSDGTPEETVTAIADTWTVEGQYDPEDPAQALIAGLKYEIGDGRKVWHRIVSADGSREWVGRATVSAIVAGGGDASAYETFSCAIRFDTKPEVTDVVPAG